jgi:hypothetical protein
VTSIPTDWEPAELSDEVKLHTFASLELSSRLIKQITHGLPTQFGWEDTHPGLSQYSSRDAFRAYSYLPASASLKLLKVPKYDAKLSICAMRFGSDRAHGVGACSLHLVGRTVAPEMLCCAWAVVALYRDYRQGGDRLSCEDGLRTG